MRHLNTFLQGAGDEPEMTMMHERVGLITSLRQHKPFDVMEKTHVLHTLYALEHVPDIGNRKCFSPGHLTAGAIVVSPDFKRVVVQMHKHLGIPLFPGGHADGMMMLAGVAVKEFYEEVGKMPIKLVALFDVDTHQVPPSEKKGEPEHLHYDFRYLFTLDDKLPLPESPEGIVNEWRDIEELVALFPAGGGRRRCVDKLVALRLERAA